MSMNTYPSLPEHLAREEPRTPREVLYAMACAGAHGDPVPFGLLERVPDLSDLVGPVNPGAPEAWLFDCEMLALARRALGPRGQGLALPVPQVDDPWRFGALADARTRLLGPVEPWDQLDTSLPQGLDDQVADAWIGGLLSQAASTEMAEAVASPGPRQDAYRRQLQRRVALVQGLDVSWFDDTPLFEVSLPHAGGRLRIERSPDGLCWNVPWETRSVKRQDRVDWGDSVTGALTTRLDLQAADEVAELRAGLDRLAGSPTLEAARRAVDVLLRGPALRWLQEADAATGDVDEVDGWHSVHRRVQLATELRLVLQDVADELDDFGLFDALSSFDEGLEDLGPVTAFIDDASWRALTDERWLDEHTWWGRRRAAEEVFGDADLEAAFGTSLVGSYKLPLRAAAEPADAGWSAETPLLLVQDGAGLVARLVLRQGGAWNARMDIEAHDAIHRAYSAVSSCTRDGRPIASFSDVGVDVGLASAEDEARLERGFNGESCALPAALALAAAWCGRAIPRDLASTGRLFKDGQGVWRVGVVGGVPEKAWALSVVSGGRPVRLLVAPEQVDQVDAPGVIAVPVVDIAEALAVAELDLSGLAATLTAFDAARRARKWMKRFEDQDHRRGRVVNPHDTNPWLRLAEEVDYFRDALTNRELALKVRAWASLAFLYAGAPDNASSLPSEDEVNALDPQACDTATLRALIRMLALAHALNTPGVDDARRRQLDAQLADARPSPGEGFVQLTGRILGTRGRALNFLGESDAALVLLRKAWLHHQQYLPHESARSAIYLAQCLRRSGRLADAQEVVVAAREQLEDIEALSYREATDVFLSYEESKLELTLAMVQSDLTRVRDCLALVDATVARCYGPWPALGLLRCRAWACALLGDEAERSRSLQLLDRHRAYKPAVAAEAEAPPSVDLLSD